LRHTDLLAKYGPEKVADAIGAIADDLHDWIGPDDEIGSSDVSGWVKRVEQELGAMSEGEPGDLEHELERQDYEHDRERDEQAEKELDEEKPGLWANIHAKRERIKHGSGEKMRKPGSKGAPTAQNFRDAAKEDVEMDEGVIDTLKKVGGKVLDTLGHGSDEDLLKDLKKKAGVRNPENGKPSMAHSDVEKVDEDLGPEQKRVGQLGPTEKVKNNNIGKLVGANESVELSEMDKSEDRKGPEGKATPVKAKDFAKDAEKKLGKAMDKEHKKDVKEGQEDLDAILRIIKK
jgi:hypothetical protein